MKKISSILLSSLFMGTGMGTAQRYMPVSLPSIYADHMVLQQQTTATIWGYGSPNNTIKIVGSWSEKDTVKTVVDCMGKWKTKIRTGKAGGPYTLQAFDERTKVVINDVMLGEVWLCSGQSNMEWPAISGLTDREKEVASADCPQIRIFSVPKRASRTLQEESQGKWNVCSPEIMREHSAVAYFFARHLSDSLKVPVGVMTASWGGTPAEVWTPSEVVEGNSDLWLNRTRGYSPMRPMEPGLAYNQMIHPLLSNTFAGAIWYQGESNTGNAHTYGPLIKNMIDAWRREAGWCFPFYLVQIAPHTYNSKDNGPALVREAQEWVTRHTDKTGLVIISDCVDDIHNIHPISKHPVGKRLAEMALSKKYKVIKGIHESPFLRQCEVQNGKLVLTFSSAQNGLTCSDKEIKGLEIAGPDGIYVKAQGKINRQNQLVVFSPQVKMPIAARYCFDDATIGNLYNKEGYPVAPFRTNAPQ